MFSWIIFKGLGEACVPPPVDPQMWNAVIFSFFGTKVHCRITDANFGFGFQDNGFSIPCKLTYLYAVTPDSSLLLWCIHIGLNRDPLFWSQSKTMSRSWFRSVWMGVTCITVNPDRFRISSTVVSSLQKLLHFTQERKRKGREN